MTVVMHTRRHQTPKGAAGSSFMGVSHRIVAAQLPHAQRITPVGKIPAQLMPCRVALYPQRWSLYLMGGDKVSRRKQRAKNGLIGADRPTTNSLVAPVIITIVPVPHDPGDGTSSHGSNITSLPTSTHSLKSISNHAKAHSEL